MSYLSNFGHTACLELVHVALTQQLLEKQFNRSALGNFGLHISVN